MLSGDVDKSLKNLFNLLEIFLNVPFANRKHWLLSRPFDMAILLQENQTIYWSLKQTKKILFKHEQSQ